MHCALSFLQTPHKLVYLLAVSLFTFGQLCYKSRPKSKNLNWQAVSRRLPRYAPTQACKWRHDIRHVRIWIGHHYCISMLACQYNQPKWPDDLDLWPFDPESGVRVMCDVGYLCANFGLPRPLCSRLRPDVRDRQTSDSIIVYCPLGGVIKISNA